MSTREEGTYLKKRARERIFARMAELRINQKELGERAGLSKSAITRYLSGERDPRMNTVAKLARALEWPVYRLTDRGLDELEMANLNTGQVGRQVHRMREMAEMTPEDLVARSDPEGKHGITPDFIVRLERGEERDPLSIQLLLIAMGLGFYDGVKQLLEASAPPDHVLGPLLLKKFRSGPPSAEGRMREIAREELAQAGVTPIREAGAAEVVKIPHGAVVSAGAGRGYREYGELEIPKSWLRGRELFAVTARGDCMSPAIPDGATIICEKVYRIEEVPNGTLCIVWIDDADEDLGGNVKYVEWHTKKVKLTADDGSVKVVDRDALHVVGKVWRSFTDW